MRMPSVVQPRAIRISVALDHEHVALPMSDGVAHPCGIWIGLESAAVEEDLAVMTIVPRHHDQRGRLDDTALAVPRREVRRTERQAQGVHAFLRKLTQPLEKQRLRPRSDVLARQIDSDIVVVAISAV